MSTPEEDKSRVTKFLGYVSARIISTYPPQRTDVIWAKPDGVINEVKKYILHFWNGIAWVPLGDGSSSGNYDTLIPDGVTMPQSVGGISSGTLVETLRGKPFIEMWNLLLFPSMPPVYNAPEATLAGSSPKIFQVGNAVDITLTSTFIQKDGGGQTGYSLLKNGSNISSANPFTDMGAIMTAPGVIVYEGLFDYAQGPVKNDNYGNPIPTGQIPAGNVYTDPEIYKWIFPYYYGSSASNVGINVLLGTKVLAEIGATLTVSFPANGPLFYWLAIPSSTPDFIRYFITEISKGLIGPGNAWEPPIPINVSDGNFVNEPYDLYITGYVTQFNLPVKFER